MPHVLVCTPSYGEQLATVYVNSVLQLREHLLRQKPQIPNDMYFFGYAAVAYARNVFASRMLEHAKYTHLLMIDSDMGFPPDIVVQMLAFDKPICGAIYPKRMIDLDRMITAARQMPEDTAENRRRAVASSYDFVGERYLKSRGSGARRQIDLQQGFIRADACGAGVMLIKRHVLEEMRARFPELMSSSIPPAMTGLKQPLFQPFNDYVESGVTLSEDFSFCRRWTKDLGGELWVHAASEISHHGSLTHTAKFMDKLMAMAATNRATTEKAG